MTDSMLERVRKLLAKAEDPGLYAGGGRRAQRQGGRAHRQVRGGPGPAGGVGAGVRPGRRPGGGRARAVRVGQDRAAGHGGAGHALPDGAAASSSGRAATSTTCTCSDSPPTWSAPSCCSPRCWSRRRTGWPRRRVPGWESVAAFRRSWLAGFTHAVGQRLQEAERRAADRAHADAGPSVALVLADRGRLVRPPGGGGVPAPAVLGPAPADWAAATPAGSRRASGPTSARSASADGHNDGLVAADDVATTSLPLDLAIRDVSMTS